METVPDAVLVGHGQHVRHWRSPWLSRRWSTRTRKRGVAIVRYARRRCGDARSCSSCRFTRQPLSSGRSIPGGPDVLLGDAGPMAVVGASRRPEHEEPVAAHPGLCDPVRGLFPAAHLLPDALRAVPADELAGCPGPADPAGPDPALLAALQVVGQPGGEPAGGDRLHAAGLPVDHGPGHAPGGQLRQQPGRGPGEEKGRRHPLDGHLPAHLLFRRAPEPLHLAHRLPGAHRAAGLPGVAAAGRRRHRLVGGGPGRPALWLYLLLHLSGGADGAPGPALRRGLYALRAGLGAKPAGTAAGAGLLLHRRA